MTYTGDKYMYCSDKKCGKKTKHVKCGGCNGKGSGSWTQCGNRCDSEYKCENGRNDKWHG